MATIRLAVREVAQERGIENPHALAARTGLGYAICYRLWNSEQQRIDLKTLARLCEALKTTPGQLLEYSPRR
jgi:DNA-binding Xre family transcriptional regulator